MFAVLVRELLIIQTMTPVSFSLRSESPRDEVSGVQCASEQHIDASKSGGRRCMCIRHMGEPFKTLTEKWK